MSDASIDPVVFAHEVLRADVQEHQAEALRCGRPRVVLAAGRRSGKSWLAQVKATHVCWTQRDVQVLVMHTDRDKGREWLRECADLMQRSPLGRAVELDEQAQVLRFPGSGSEIVVLASTNRSPRGFGRRVVLVIVEEASYQANAVWSGLRFTLLDNKAECWMTGTPDCAFEHFFRQSWELGRSGDPDYAAFSWRTAQNRLIARDDLAREAERLTESERMSQLEGEWSDMEGSFLPRELLRSSTAPELELPELHEVPGSIRVALGLDYAAQGMDHSAAVMLARLPIDGLQREGPALSRFVLIPKVWPARTHLSDVVDTVAVWPARYAWVASETNGVGAMPSEAIRRALEGRTVNWAIAATTNARKIAGYTALKWLLERGQLILPPHPDLQRELAGLKFQRGDRGLTQIEAGSAADHDDVSDAAVGALGVHPKPRRGMVRVELALRADPVNATPVAPVDLPCTPDDLIETGGGVQLWRRPPLQSITGTDLFYQSE